MSSKRSKFEDRMAAVLEPANFQYEPWSMKYEITHRYTPDFVYDDVMVEAKGWFRPGDRQKYKAIRDALEPPEELVFLLQSPHKKVQKGAKLTMSGWCEKENIKWFSRPEEVIKYANP